MKHKIIYTLLFSLTFLGGIDAQLDCIDFFDVDLNVNGEGLVQASDLVTDVEFFIANGTLTYFILPFNSGVFTSGSDAIQLNCNNAGIHEYIIEYTVDGALIETCYGTLNVFDPSNSCENSSYCEINEIDCFEAYGGSSFITFPPNPIPAENFAICSSSANCTGIYKIAVGTIAEATLLTYNETLSEDDIVNYSTPVVLSYKVNGGTQFDQSNIYVYENLDCFIIPKSSLTVELDITQEFTIVPDMFLEPDNTCTDITLAVTNVNGDIPTDFFDSVSLDCDDLGYHTVYLKDGETGMTVSSQLFLADPLETCGPILGPGDKLIKMSNNPPLGTYATTSVSVNGAPLMSSNTGKGWIINENLLVDGTNELIFTSGPFIPNGVSTLDIVNLQRIIIMDIFNDPMESIVMDVDESGYNGIGDLILTRKIILGQSYSQVIPNVLFKPTELQFPSDFSPFDFDYDFTKYEFDKADFDDLTFRFEGYKVGDMNGTAAVEDSIKSNVISTTRDLDAFEVSDMDVVAGTPFNFSLKYDKGVPIKGLLAALVSNGITFETLTSQIGNNQVQYNVINDTEIRVSYVSNNPDETIESISFEITAISSNSGALIDLLGLKSGFPQEVINEDDEVIVIEELQESTMTAASNIDLSAEISIYPNPANQDLKISIAKGSIGKVEILDPMGKRVILGKSDNDEMYIDISNLAKGLYYISIENNKNITNKSFIKI